MKKFFPSVSLFLIIAGGCNSGKSSENPEQILSKFFTALSTRDIQEARKYVTADSEGMINMMQMGLQYAGDSGRADMFDPQNIELGDPKINGNEAVIPVTEKSTNETLNFILQKENGNWKVAFDFATLGRMAKEKMSARGINPAELDSLIDKIPKTGLERTGKNPDSLSKVLKDISPEKIKEVKKMLDSLQTLNH